MSRRSATTIVAAFLLVALVAVASLLPVPYVALVPGPTTNTLGSQDGTPLIEIEGAQTYATEGHLDLTTVKVLGGPGRRLSLVTALRGWVDPEVAVVPEETVYPQGISAEQVEEQNAEEMETSQESATTAALRALGYDIPVQIAVGAIVPEAPALGVLKAGDIIVAVSGVPVTSSQQVAELVRATTPGSTVRFTVLRDGQQLELDVPTKPAPDDASAAAVGIVPEEVFDYPFEVTIQLDDVGGPSAGLMFALGIIDKLTPGEITGGTFVAGTGEIDDDGTVGSIGGIQQKVVAAYDAGAGVFLTPADNCAAAVSAAPEGLQLVKVDTLQTALDALERLRRGEPATPSCTS
jgi:Lon-like protease